jgi:diguanylate cyclase (GGDEF)-like protein
MTGGAARRSARRQTFLLSGAFVMIAVLIVYLQPTPIMIDTPLPRWALLAVLAGAFLLGEQFLLNIEFRRQAHSLTLAGIPLAIGLLTMPVADLVLARLVGAATALILQRISLEKIIYNCSAYVFETAVNAAVLFAFFGPRTALDVPVALGVLVVIAVCDQVMSLFVLYVIWLHGGPVSRKDLRDVLLPALVLAVASTAVAIGSLLLANAGPLGFGVIAVFMVAGIVLYRSYLATTRRHQRLELLHEFVNGGVGAQSLREVAEQLLARIRSLLRASSVDLLLMTADLPPGTEAASEEADHGPTAGLRPARQTTRFSDDETNGFSVTHDDAVLDWATIRALDEAEPLLAPRSTKDRAVRRWLHEHDRLDAILVPLPETNGFVGTLTVCNRLGETATFTADDMTLLQALAGHLAVAGGSARLVERLAYEASHDSLTGLANRSFLSRDIEQHVSAPGTAACVLVLDLDRFKEVNDALGHSAGDRLLRIVGARLREFLPPSATVARLGGDEFAALVPDLSGGESAARMLGQELAAHLSRPVTFPEALLTPDASIGLAVSTGDTPMTDLLRQADTAMYAAKADDSTVAIYSSTMDSGRIENLALLADLRMALRHHPEQIEVYFQPQIDLQTRKVVSAEALVRWNHPNLGLLGPDRFIPLAETTGLINEFTPLILNAAVGECRRWRDSGRHISVAVNLSARDVGDSALPERIRHALAYAGVPPSSLTVEITESSIISDPQQTLHVLDRFADLGVAISLDDFGTGYSSLSYLQQLPVREVKIDRSFILGLTSADPRSSRALISSIAGLGANLGLRVVAEGVESEEVMDELQHLGCHVAQGFHISRPVPRGAFRQWLNDNAPARDLPPGDAPLRLVATN